MLHNEFKDRIINDESSSNGNSSYYGNIICNLEYLTEMMGGKNNLILGIIDAFLKQIPEELQAMNTAISKEDFTTIKSFAHTMKSSVSIMGISTLTPILQEMENLGGNKSNIKRIKELAIDLNVICKLAIDEIERERPTYC